MKQSASIRKTTAGPRRRPPRPGRRLGLPLACVFALAACAPGGAADAEPATIEVPPPVEQTNEGLTIYYTDADPAYTSLLDAAVIQYNAQHPDQPLTAEKIFTEGSDIVQEQENQQMLTEVMAGEGPDLILFVDDTMDVEKMARRGVFADMEPYFEADAFDWSGYNEAVMNGGVWDGHRLVIPLEYQIPVWYSSKSALEESGFQVENCATFAGFLDEAEKLQNTPGQTRSLYRTFLAFNDFAQYAGIPYADYARQRADFSVPELERGLNVYRNVTDLHYDNDELPGAADIRDGKALWISPVFPPTGVLIGAGLINTFDELVMMPLRDLEGGIRAKITLSVAVSNSSPNLQNAYEFIKFLLSEQFQLDTMDWRWQNFSVLDATNEEHFRYNTTDRHTALIWPDNSGGFTDVEPRWEDFDAVMAYADQVAGVFYPCEQTRFVDAMEKYLSGETSYANAAKAAQSQLNIYLSE